MKICNASMSPFFARVTWQSKSSRWRGSPRESEWSGKATTREADTSTVRPGHRITRLAVIFVHLFSHRMTTGKGCTWRGSNSRSHVLARLSATAGTNLVRVNLEGNQASIRDACDAGLLAGAVTVVWQHGHVLQVNEIGYRDIDAKLPMQRDTLFRIASMTKPVTVAAAMSLGDEGKLALRDPIVRWLPEFADLQVLDDPGGPLDRTHPVQRAILVEDLLTHTSGLAYGFSVAGPISRAYVRLPFGRGPRSEERR